MKKITSKKNYYVKAYKYNSVICKNTYITVCYTFTDDHALKFLFTAIVVYVVASLVLPVWMVEYIKVYEGSALRMVIDKLNCPSSKSFNIMGSGGHYRPHGPAEFVFGKFVVIVPKLQPDDVCGRE